MREVPSDRCSDGMPIRFAGASEAGNKCRDAGRIRFPFRSKGAVNFLFFLLGQPCIHGGQDREHGQSQYGRPLQEKAEHDDDESDVLGKPYISTKRATMNAENVLKVLQSLFVCGLKKLNANRMKTAELIRTSDQRP
jgi:hypothetical protein